MSLESYVLVLRLGSHGTSHWIPLNTHSVPHVHPVLSVPCGTLGSQGTSHSPTCPSRTKCTVWDSGIPWYIPLDPTPHTQSHMSIPYQVYHVGLWDPMVHPIASHSTHSVPHVHPVSNVPCWTLGSQGTSHWIPLHTLSPTCPSCTKCTMLDSGIPWYIPFHPIPSHSTHSVHFSMLY